MLVYKCAFDLYHCMFRIVKLLEACPNNEISQERARIYDYYFSFPHRVYENVKFVRGSGFTKSQFKTPQNNYLTIQDDKQTFFEMNKVFEGATRCLAAYGVIDLHSLKSGCLKLSEQQKINTSKEELTPIDGVRARIVELFSGPFYDLPFSGDNGLKARTGLMDHRYDK